MTGNWLSSKDILAKPSYKKHEYTGDCIDMYIHSIASNKGQELLI